MSIACTLLYLKRILREKTLIKNFFKYKSGVNHYHFARKSPIEMIDYTFLLPGKNEGIL